VLNWCRQCSFRVYFRMCSIPLSSNDSASTMHVNVYWIELFLSGCRVIRTRAWCIFWYHVIDTVFLLIFRRLHSRNQIFLFSFDQINQDFCIYVYEFEHKKVCLWLNSFSFYLIDTFRKIKSLAYFPVKKLVFYLCSNPGYWNNYYYRDTEIVLIPIAATSKMKSRKFDPKVVDIFINEAGIMYRYFLYFS
jgi:hypothetical protein